MALSSSSKKGLEPGVAPARGWAGRDAAGASAYPTPGHLSEVTLFTWSGGVGSVPCDTCFRQEDGVGTASPRPVAGA